MEGKFSMEKLTPPKRRSENQRLQTFLGRISTFVLISAGIEIIAAPPPPVYIRDLRVPRTIVNGSENNVVLDCDYRLERNETTLLVVNWYLNHSELVYQWIYGNAPQALGRLHDRLNLNYEASDVAFEKYRALQIVTPTIDLSGEYSCKVSTIAGEAYKTAKMTVYCPATDVDLKISPYGPGQEFESNLLNVSCWAYGVFPKPIVTLYYGTNETHRQPLEDVEADVSNTDDDAFDTFVYKIIDKDNVSSTTLFTCDLKITDTNYYMRKELYWRKDGSKASLISGSPIIFIAVLLAFLGSQCLITSKWT